jgi:hypothetical protein
MGLNHKQKIWLVLQSVGGLPSYNLHIAFTQPSYREKFATTPPAGNQPLVIRPRIENLAIPLQ